MEGMNYRLVDSSVDKQGTFLDGIEIENPDIIHQCRYDCVVIATGLYFQDIRNVLMRKYSVPYDKIIALSDLQKEALMRDIGMRPAKKTGGPRILFGYCFLIYENCRIHDYLLAQSLRLRGAEIIPVSCGGAQKQQCSVYGGAWGNDTHDIHEKELNHRDNCFQCMGCDKRTWSGWGGFEMVSAADFLTEDEKRLAEDFISQQDIRFIENWNYEYFPIGRWALRTYFNIELISHKDRWDEIEEGEIRCMAYNVMAMCIASQKIVEYIKPDIIYSNDSFYYPYSILEVIAKEKNILFYNAYGHRKNTYTYAMGTPSISMKFDSAWETFSKRELEETESRFIDEYVLNRKHGRDMLINTADPFQSAREVKSSSVHGTMRKDRKTALLATNVTWDAAALDKGIAFKNIEEWVLHTVDFFENNSEWQLIVRSHPAEMNKLMPEARERVCQIVLTKYDGRLPDNIILIDGDAPVSIYELFDHVDIGITYTTTAGIEMCCNGIPVITVADAPYRGKGFTYDPVCVKEYEDCLETLMNGLIPKGQLEMWERQAKKYFLLYYFIYMLPCPFHRYERESGAEMKIKSAAELLPGNDEILDYICDSILEQKAILSKDRFPPYRLEV